MRVGTTDESPPRAACTTLAAALVEGLSRLGVRQAHGVSGGAMAAIWHALSASPLAVRHFRHESGAVFAAIEEHFATGRPGLVFTTTGPGLTNAITGLLAARGDGAKLILVSACTSAPARGRFAIQETGTRTMPRELHERGALFHLAEVLETPEALPGVLRDLAQGLAGPGGFVAHIAVPTAVQALPAASIDAGERLPRRPSAAAAPEPTPQALQVCAQALLAAPFAIWLGFGARGAAAEVRGLVERTGAPAFCTPRGKGILPETHPRFIGVTGMGGHDSVPDWVSAEAPARILVLGSRLGEASSLYDPRLVPREGFVHVDIDPAVVGIAYPMATTLAVPAEVGAWLRALLEILPARAAPRTPLACRRPVVSLSTPAGAARVRPEALMDAIQRHIVDASDAIVLAESGNAFVWATHRLRFAEPGRYRASTAVGAMGHAAAGVVGAALARGRRAVAIVGDGALLMHNEINTAVKYGAPATWIVLNDGRYGMCHQGMESLGLQADALFPAVDFVAFARAQGADAVCVRREDELAAALARAMQASGPFVVDVLVDPSARAPALARNRGLACQLAAGRRADVSFPTR